MPKSITLKKRVDDKGNPILDENGQEIMDVISEEEIEEQEQTPADFLQSLSPELQSQIAGLLGFGD